MTDSEALALSVLVLFLLCSALNWALGGLASPPDLRVLRDPKVVEVNAHRAFLSVTCPGKVQHATGVCGCSLAEEED